MPDDGHYCGDASCDHDHGPPPPIRSDERPGRNDPCWCGSGKKYKRCHLEPDEAAAP